MSAEKRRQYGTGSVYQRGDGRWMGVLQAGWTDRGTRRVITVSATTEVLAKRKLDRKRHELDDDPTAKGGAKMTVRTWADTWLEARVHKASPKYYATDASSVRKWIVPTIGHKRLEALTPADVRAVTNAVRDAGRSTTTARYAQGVLERMLRAAMVEGARVPARVLMLEAPGKAVSDRDAIPLPDALLLLERALTRPDAGRWVAALLQGMRQGEALGLTWQAIDFDAGTIDVSWQLQVLPYLDRKAGTFRVPDGFEVIRLTGAWHLKRPKSAAGYRIIPLVPWMAAALHEWRTHAPASPHGLVWPRPDGTPRSDKDDRAEFYALQDEAGIKHPSGRHWLVHEARHAAGTMLAAAGVDKDVITAIMGHSSYATSLIYIHTDHARKLLALTDVAGRLGLGAIEG